LTDVSGSGSVCVCVGVNSRYTIDYVVKLERRGYAHASANAPAHAHVC
jgi:hypothetical protein